MSSAGRSIERAPCRGRRRSAPICAGRLSKIWYRGEAQFEQEIEQILLPVVVAKLPFIEIERELHRADAVVFDELPLGVGPEAFEAVDVHLAARKAPRVV